MRFISFFVKARERHSLLHGCFLAFATLVAACGSTTDSDANGPDGSGGVFGSGGALIGSGGAILGSGGAIIGSGGAVVGSGGASPGTGGFVGSGGLPSGTGGASATGGSPGTGGVVGVDPSDLAVTAYGANTTVGLEWPDV